MSQFQRRFLATQVVWLLGSVLLLAAVAFVPTGMQLTSSDPEVKRAAADRFLFLHAVVWPLVPVVFGLAGCAMVLITHRLAGPLYRFRRVFDAVADGQLDQRVRLRKGDYLVSEAEALDRMIGSLRARLAPAQVELAGMQAQLTELARRDRVVSGAELAGIVEATSRIETLLGYFSSEPSDASIPDERASGPPTSPAPATESGAGHARDRPVGQSGFTLVEMLLVVAIMGIVAALALPLYGNALKQARITRAIGDIEAISKSALTSHVIEGCFPDSLADMGMAQLRDPWDQSYSYAVIGGRGRGGGGGGLGGGGGGCEACGGACIGIGGARKDRNLVPVNSDFDVYSVGPDGKSAGPLTAQQSHDDIVRAADGGFIGLGKDY